MESSKPQESTESRESNEPQESPESQVSSTPVKKPGKKRLKRLHRVVVVVVGVALGLSIAASYAGIQPFATYKDLVMQRAVTLDDFPVSAPEDVYPRTRRFAGTYRNTVPVLDYEQTLTFQSDTVTMVDEFAGTVVFRYVATMQSETEGVLDLEDVGSGKVTRVPMQYVLDADCFILYPQGRESEGATYCK